MALGFVAVLGKKSLNIKPRKIGFSVARDHDENGTGEFDQTWISRPDEGLGFSNGAWIGLGPPAFGEAALEVSEKDRVIAVTLRY